MGLRNFLSLVALSIFSPYANAIAHNFVKLVTRSLPLSFVPSVKPVMVKFSKPSSLIMSPYVCALFLLYETSLLFHGCATVLKCNQRIGRFDELLSTLKPFPPFNTGDALLVSHDFVAISMANVPTRYIHSKESSYHVYGLRSSPFPSYSLYKRKLHPDFYNVNRYLQFS